MREQRWRVTSAGVAPLRLIRLGARPLDAERHEGAERRIRARDLRRSRIDHLDRRELSRAVARDQLVCGQAVVAHSDRQYLAKVALPMRRSRRYLSASREKQQST